MFVLNMKLRRITGAGMKNTAPVSFLPTTKCSKNQIKQAYLVEHQKERKIVVTTQPSFEKVLKIFERNKELIHRREKENRPWKGKNLRQSFLWISSFV